MKEDQKPKYLRMRDSTRVFHANDNMLRRGDMYACDLNGNLLTTNAMQVPDEVVIPAGPGQDKEKIELDKLRERGRLLKVPGYNNAKKETIIKGIKKAENELAKLETRKRIAAEEEQKAADEKAKKEKDKE